MESTRGRQISIPKTLQIVEVAATRGREPELGHRVHEASQRRVLLVYNDSMTERTPLTAALSTDGDQTYPQRRNIAKGRNSFAYPIGFQASDGPIHIVYTSDQRSVVNHAVFSEEWVKQGRR
jgi:BNR repeat-like domain